MISIIVCTYNRDKYLYNALQHIAANDYDFAKYEIVLVNNNSTDSTDSECKRFAADFPQVNFRYFVETNQGLSFARNRGIGESSGEILVFLDDDSFVEPDYLANLDMQMAEHKDAMAFGGQISPVFEEGNPPKWLNRWTYSLVSAIDLGKNVRLFEGKYYPIGANMGFRRECLDKIGNFNTELGRSKKNLMGGEEKDIFGRMRNLGMKIYYFPDIHVNHIIPPSRTTNEYVYRAGLGIGMSEQLRCRKIGKSELLRRYFAELVKWGGTFVIWFWYLLCLNVADGNVIVRFRWNVSKGLFGKLK
ncbi:MAG: glycosyltransferase family 2 protein [Bacteroidales bacterium]|nr:glycosyltransferase family 2 protein [Bacteroidales bacterium]